MYVRVESLAFQLDWGDGPVPPEGRRKHFKRKQHAHDGMPRREDAQGLQGGEPQRDDT